MPFSWGAAATQFGKDLPTIGASIDNIYDLKRKNKRQEEIDQRQAILDSLTAQESQADLAKMADEKAMQEKGRSVASDYLSNLDKYQGLQSELMPKPTPEMLQNMDAKGNPIGVPYPRELTKREKGVLNTNELIGKVKKPAITDKERYYSAYEPGLEKIVKEETVKEKSGGLFAGWKKKNEERDAIISGYDPYRGNKLETEADKQDAWDMWEKTWATSTALGITPKYIEGAAKKAGATAGAAGFAGTVGKAAGETKSNIESLPGFKPIPGVKITDESVAKVKGIAPDIETMKKLADELIQKYDSMGSVFTGNDAADYSSKVRNLQLLAKSPSLYNLGVLTGPDLMLLEQTIPNPASIKEGVKKQVLGDISVKLKNFRNLIDMRGNQFYKTNGFEIERTPETKIINGVTYKKVAGGWQRQ